jgi:sec-independent protein translocase protein TatB
MGNLGGGEILVILLVALIVLGPTKLPEASRQVGKAVREMRRMSGAFQRELREAINDPITETKAMMKGAGTTPTPPSPTSTDDSDPPTPTPTSTTTDDSDPPTPTPTSTDDSDPPTPTPTTTDSEQSSDPGSSPPPVTGLSEA